MTTVERPSMVSDETPIENTVLLLGDESMGQELAPQLDKLPVNVVADPYEALRQLAEARYAAVIITGPREEFDGLTRAVRRLCGDATLLAFARAEDQQALRESGEDFVDRFCLFPPTRGELSSLTREFGPPGATAEPLRALKATELENLILATHNVAGLEDAVVALFAEHDVDVAWANADEFDDADALLKSPVNPGRALVLGEGMDLSDSADAIVDNVYQMLPALLRVAGRCESLHRLAITDHLTGAYNRRYFYHLTNHVLSRSKDEGFRATLLLYDIDDFKQYNDQYGHAAGDNILRDTARLMTQVCREQDIVARIGGDEFAVLFWDSQPREAGSEPLRDIVAVADRFRNAVREHHFPALGSDAKGVLTISGGLATYPEYGQTCLELLQQADQAMRNAKQAGKDGIRLIGQ
ncbi:MAG: diguanylate cyclase [Planctomycetes bacterium]|jgi:diguanylate cyclase (GGDEF)-like protein|nr:diguanylate cyclase [Phycisphaerae bacterium]NBB95286.1 diguanylate cyclase [Planctomycetota bacterium]